MWDDRDTRSVIVGVAGMLLVHLLLFILVPRLLRSDFGAHAIRPDTTAPFDIELAPEEFVKPPEPPPMNFVEANPNAPDNVPDQTNNFAARRDLARS